MPYCPECGEELLETAKFCANCGTPINRIDVDVEEIEDEDDSTSELVEQVSDIASTPEPETVVEEPVVAVIEEVDEALSSEPSSVPPFLRDVQQPPQQRPQPIPQPDLRSQPQPQQRPQPQPQPQPQQQQYYRPPAPQPYPPRQNQPTPPYGYPYQQPQPPKPKHNGKAIAGFIVSLCGLGFPVLGVILGLVGTILALVGFNECEQKGNRRSRPFAVAGIIIGVIAFIVGLVVAGLLIFEAGRQIGAASQQMFSFSPYSNGYGIYLD